MLMTPDKAIKACDKLAKDGKTLHDLIQEICLVAVAHSIPASRGGLGNGNIMIGEKLLQSMPEGTRRSAVTRYLETFGCFRLVGKTETKPAHFSFKNNEKAKWSEQVEESLRNGKSWSEFSPEPEPKSIYDPLKDVELILKRIATRNQKALEHAQKGEPIPRELQVKHQDFYEYLNNTYKEYLVKTAEKEAAPVDTVNPPMQGEKQAA